MASTPRTLFVIVNDKNLILSETDTNLFHDQWFIHNKLTDENMCRRFLDMHVRGYYKDGQIFFYRSPTKIYDDQDCTVMTNILPELVNQLKQRKLISANQNITVHAGYGLNSKLFTSITVS